MLLRAVTDSGTGAGKDDACWRSSEARTATQTATTRTASLWSAATRGLSLDTGGRRRRTSQVVFVFDLKLASLGPRVPLCSIVGGALILYFGSYCCALVGLEGRQPSRYLSPAPPTTVTKTLDESAPALLLEALQLFMTMSVSTSPSPPLPPNTHKTGIISIRRSARLPNTHPHQIETVLITLGPSSCNHLEVGFSGPGQGQRPSISKDGPAGGAGGRAVDQTRATLFGGEDGPGKACYEQILAGEPVKQISADEWDLQQTLDKVMAGPGSVVTQEQYEENGIPYSNNRAQAKFPILRDGKLPPDMLWTDGRHRIMVVNSMSILVDSTRAAANSLDGGAEALDEMMRQLQGRTGTVMATLYGPDSEWTARAGQALMRAFATAMG